MTSLAVAADDHPRLAFRPANDAERFDIASHKAEEYERLDVAEIGNGNSMELSKEVYARKVPLLTEKHFDLAQTKMKESRGGLQTIYLTLTPGGRQLLKEWSALHVSERLCIFIDGKLISAPVIREVMDVPVAALTVSAQPSDTRKFVEQLKSLAPKQSG